MKKKLLSIILMVALVLAMVLTVAACNDDKGAAVTAAAEAFRKAHISDTYDKESYDLAGSFTYENATYTITWTSDKNTVKFAPSADGKTVKVTVTKTSEAQEYKLTATLSDGEGNTATAEFKGTIEANANADGNLGTTYKLAIRQLTNGTVLYAKAEAAATYYLGSATVATDGADFYTEDVTGGKKIFTMVGVNKCYLGAKVSGTHNNICLGGVVNDMNTTYEGSVWTISDDEIKTTVDGKTLYLGTYGDKTTFSVSEYKTYPAFLVAAGTEVNAQGEVKVASKSSENAHVTFTSPASTESAVTVNVATVVTFTVAVDEGHELVNVTINGEAVTDADGVYTVTVSGAHEIFVSTKDSSAEKLPVDSIKFDMSKINEKSTSAVSDLSEAFETAVGEATSYLVSAQGTNIYLNTGSGGCHPNVSGMLKLGKSKTAGQIVLTFVGNADITRVAIKCHDFYAYKENGTPESKISVNSGEQQDCPYNVDGEFATVIFDLDTPTNAITIDTTGRAYILEIVVYLGEQGELPVDNSVAKIGETGYETLAAAVAAAAANDTIVLQKDAKVDDMLVITKKITIDLNGKTITSDNNIWVSSETEKKWSLISVREGGDLTINDSSTAKTGKVVAKEGNLTDTISCYAVDVYATGAKLTINAGEFIGNRQCIYVNTGSATINGGKYSIYAGSTNDTMGHKFVLNLLDANHADGTATISVTGGSFVNYDPANAPSESDTPNLVATGYTVTSATIGTDTVYTVTAVAAD